MGDGMPVTPAKEQEPQGRLSVNTAHTMLDNRGREYYHPPPFVARLVYVSFVIVVGYDVYSTLYYL